MVDHILQKHFLYKNCLTILLTFSLIASLRRNLLPQSHMKFITNFFILTEVKLLHFSRVKLASIAKNSLKH